MVMPSSLPEVPEESGGANSSPTSGAGVGVNAGAGSTATAGVAVAFTGRVAVAVGTADAFIGTVSVAVGTPVGRSGVAVLPQAANAAAAPQARITAARRATGLLMRILLFSLVLYSTQVLLCSGRGREAAGRETRRRMRRTTRQQARPPDCAVRVVNLATGYDRATRREAVERETGASAGARSRVGRADTIEVALNGRVRDPVRLVHLHVPNCELSAGW